jgi:hypothetical protein
MEKANKKAARFIEATKVTKPIPFDEVARQLLNTPPAHRKSPAKRAKSKK